MIKFYSPLRYPGGKQKLAEFIERICIDNRISGHYVEPYAGGASIALHLLLTGRVREITINDLDKAIYAFWWSVKNEPTELCQKIETTAITITEWKKQKMILTNKKNEIDFLRLGFATLFLNRTNYSGVLNGGVIGGVNQANKYRIDCRFNKASIIEKIRAIASHASKINVMNLDAVELISGIERDRNTIFYFDPPYFVKGQSLYMNHYRYDDHQAVSEKIKSIRNAQWIVSYDDVLDIRELYSDCNTFNYQLRHCARSSRVGKESLFFSRGLVVGEESKKQLVGAEKNE
ncbi:MAG: DNA adenine methylase [Planctomycetaceae bacterium]|jgi:DNA adenine methylase|nr:DNA adenine methylase [Planctomycetaceae bacterium]